MHIIDLPGDDQELIQGAAILLVKGFKEHWPNAWPDVDAALGEVRRCLGPGRINRVAVDDDGTLLGWIGASREYQGHAWELHPLVVHPDRQEQGIGRALVADLEARVRERGGNTLYLGTDDEDRMTSLSGVDLYPDVAGHIARIRNLRRHPYQFYQKQGYTIVGVIPDANGPGKFVSFLVENSLDLGLLFSQLFASDISTFFAVDLVITAIVFLVLAVREAGRYRMRNRWLYIVATAAVGPSFAFPLFLYFREPRMERSQ